MTSTGIYIQGPWGHPLVLTNTNSTNDTTSTIRGPGRTLGRFLGKVGLEFEDVLGRAAHRMGYGPSAMSLRIETQFDAFMKVASIWTWVRGSDPSDLAVEITNNYRKLIRYTEGYVI